jgi:bifunctional enzyme CysN/CysC
MAARGMSTNVTWQAGRVGRGARRRTIGVGATVWMTGLPGSGKSTLAAMLEEALFVHRRAAYRLDGDNLRHGLNSDLGFGPEARSENVRRAAHVACLFADAGVVAIVSLISPRRGHRTFARELHTRAELPFLEVFLDTPLEECERRDPKGLYAKARRGEITGFTGVDDPYEPPADPDVVVQTVGHDPSDGVELVMAALMPKLTVPA